MTKKSPLHFVFWTTQFVFTQVLFSLTHGVSQGSATVAERISKDDFAYGHEIEMTDRKSLIDTKLTEDVYVGLRSSTWTDLAVFNARGEQVPHIFVRPEPRVIDRSRPPTELTLFPVYGAENSESKFSHVKISTANDGTIVEIEGSPSDRTEESDKKITGYLIDASKVKEKIERLQFSVEEFQENSFYNVLIEGSQDLKNWTPLDSHGVLAKFELNAEKLTKDEIQLRGAAFNYYGISWRPTMSVPKLGWVKAIFVPQIEELENPLQWRAVSGNKVQTPAGEISYHYDTGGHFPVSGLSVKFYDQNSIARIGIESSEGENGPWLPVLTETFYSVLKEGIGLSKLETFFGSRSHRFWRLRLASSGAGVGSQFPEISFGWGSASLRFLARGEGPFTLAYGSAKTIVLPQPDLMSSDLSKETGRGSLGPQILLGGIEKLVVEPESKYPIRKIILWSILASAVVLLGSMALQVRKQIPPPS